MFVHHPSHFHNRPLVATVFDRGIFFPNTDHRVRLGPNLNTNNTDHCFFSISLTILMITDFKQILR